MGIRSNTGNIITNGIQVGAISATQAGKLIRAQIADASTALNNRQREDDRNRNISTHNRAPTQEEAEELGRMRHELEANSIRERYRRMIEGEQETPAEEEQETPSIFDMYEEELRSVSPQGEQLAINARSNLFWQEMRTMSSREESLRFIEEGR